jgi:hypothetical protein
MFFSLFRVSGYVVPTEQPYHREIDTVFPHVALELVLLTCQNIDIIAAIELDAGNSALSGELEVLF